MPSLYLPSLHTGQERVLRNFAQFNYCVMGRGWRKSSCETHRAVRGALEHGKWVVWGAENYGYLNTCWDNVTWACKDLIQADLCETNRTRMEISFPKIGSGTGRIDFCSLDNPDSPRGKSPDEVIIEEAGELSRPEAYYESFLPMLNHRPHMVLSLWGTPKGRGYFWREFMQAKRLMEKEGKACKHRAFHSPSFGVEIVNGALVRKPHPLENPTISFETALSIYNSDGMTESKFRQEFLAEFIEDGGLVYRNVDGAIMRGVKANLDPTEHYSYQMGVDLAYKHDYTVLSIRRLPDLRQVYWERFQWPSQERTELHIAEVAKKYHARVVMDATGVGSTMVSPLGKRLRAMGLTLQPYHFTNQSKVDLIDHHAALIERAASHGHPFLMDIPVQTEEMKAYQYMNSDAGNRKMGAPKGEGNFDDCVVADALACWGQRVYESPAEYLPRAMGSSAFALQTAHDPLLASWVSTATNTRIGGIGGIGGINELVGAGPNADLW